MLYDNSDEYSDEEDWDSDEDSQQSDDGTYWIETVLDPIKNSLETKKSPESDLDGSSNDYKNTDNDDDGDDGSENSANSDVSYYDEDIDDYGSDEDVKKFRIKIGELLDSGFKEQSRGDFAGYGALPSAPNPGIAIEGLGLFQLPLNESDAKKIISQSEQAPFGKKNKTIVDLSVRKTWQIDGSKIHFENPKWISFLKEQVIPKAAEKLELDSRQIDANLYKLLLYGEGGHFEAHQDTEKEPGMFGTLIIVLPSHFTGGSVTASHDSREMVIDTASSSKFDTYFTCIYSDVFHKVHPVSSGYRLVLSYNLIFKIQSEPVPKVPPVNDSIKELRNLLKDWLAQLESAKDFPIFIMHVLDHKYSRNIADELELEIYLAQIDITVEGHHEDDEATGNPDHDYSIDEVGCCSYELKDVVNPEGKEIDLSKMMINRYNAIPRMRYLQMQADDREHGDFTGNEGCEVTHYYFRTTLLLWPKSQELFMNVKASGLKSTVANLKERFALYKVKVERGANSIADRNELLAFSRIVISAYLRPSLSYESDFSQCVETLREGAVMLNAPEIFIETMIRSRSRRSELSATHWVAAIKAFGFVPLQDAVEGALKEDNFDKRLKDLLWRSHFINELVRSIPADKELKAWSGKQWIPQLQTVTTFDDQALEYAASLAQRNGFQRCEQVLIGFLENMEKVQKQFSSSSYSTIPNTPCQFIVKIFGRFNQNDDASTWCRDQLIRLAGTFDGKADHRDVKSIADFIRLCLNDPTHQAYVSPTLDAVRRLSYSSSYFDSVICTLVECLKEDLHKNSPSWKDEPYISFAAHFFIAGMMILQRHTPPLPGDYTLPTDDKCNGLMNKLLYSPIAHVLAISKSNGVLREVDKVVRRLKGAVTYDTHDGDYKHCIVIRKVQFRPRNLSDTERKALLDGLHLRPWEFLYKWREALCYQRETCECCLRIQNCIHWAEEQRIYARFCKAFGEDLVVVQKRVRTMMKSASQAQAASTDKTIGVSTSRSAVNNNNTSTLSGHNATTKLKNEDTKKKRSAKEVADLTRSPIKSKKKSRQNA